MVYINLRYGLHKLPHKIEKLDHLRNFMMKGLPISERTKKLPLRISEEIACIIYSKEL